MLHPQAHLVDLVESLSFPSHQVPPHSWLLRTFGRMTQVRHTCRRSAGWGHWNCHVACMARSMGEAWIRRKRARYWWASTCTCRLFLCGQVNSSYAFQIHGRISQFGGQLRDHAQIEVVEAYGFVNPKHINNPTPENLEAVHDRNRALIASSIKNSFWYRVSYSVFCIQVNKLISLSETRWDRLAGFDV